MPDLTTPVDPPAASTNDDVVVPGCCTDFHVFRGTCHTHPGHTAHPAATVNSLTEEP